ncbi:MAG: nuclear transport factor 2 family protein [Chitinophagaceae bacterium]|nr:nuclear transport factor 2 family protein [Chitinophagaceae bacterium]
MRDIILQYFHGLESGDADKIANLFSAGGIVHSPLYGDMPAKEFYKDLFADTKQSAIMLLNIFENTEKTNVYAVQFRYNWILKDGSKTNFECVDVFQFNEENKISELTIIYDTYKLRSIFENLP